MQWIMVVSSSAGMQLEDWQDAFDTLLDNVLGQ
jgi:hypothetical protein